MINYEVKNIKLQNHEETRTNLSRLSYIEIDDLSHLLKQQRTSSGEYIDPNWRESYYFNATDENTGLSVITTIGILPNEGRSTGFVFILRNGKIILTKLLVDRNVRLHDTDRFQLGDLSYRVEGIDWRLRYRSKKCDFDILFRPLNEYYSYIGSGKDAGVLKRLATQHIEQAGFFEGSIKLDGNQVNFGLCPGHRDHSWGIRDWGAIDNYLLISCTFSNEKAINLWKGTSGEKTFQIGYIFDSGKNHEIISSKVKNIKYTSDGREPKKCELSFKDERESKHSIKCEVVCSVPIPLPKCIVYETIARVEYDGEVGYGLLERLIHNTNPIVKLKAVIDILKRRRSH